MLGTLGGGEGRWHVQPVGGRVRIGRASGVRVCGA